MSQRTDRLDSQFRAELMDLIQREMSDPRLGFVTVTRVATAPDLASARVWVSVYGPAQDQDATMDALRGASAWLRHRLGERLTMRRVPMLDFRADQSIAGGDRVLRLLNEIDEAEKPAASEEPAP